MVSLIKQSIAGLYSPSGGFLKEDLDVTFLVKVIEGPHLLYALQKLMVWHLFQLCGGGIKYLRFMYLLESPWPKTLVTMFRVF
jgi:hypothetical protein